MQTEEKSNKYNTNSQYNKQTIRQLFDQPFLEVVYQAASVHRKHFNPQEIERATLLSIKTGACPEDCAYCPQSGHYNTDVKKENLMSVEAILTKAKIAKANGSTRFCMGAAWRNPPEKEIPKIIEIIKEVKALGLETCMTLGTLSKPLADALKEAGLDFYNHNLDSSPEFYKKIITTRSYDERLQTLQHVHDAGINICCGGIMGMGETIDDRVNFLEQLLLLPQSPQSIPINRLIATKGTPLADTKEMDHFDFIKMIAITRIVFPTSVIRLSAGRCQMSDEMQAFCFFAGANSIFYGNVLLTSANATVDEDVILLKKLGFNITDKPLSQCKS
ncbi:MAG: biotin synthase BioB [Gammaproteobacteria bacterium]|nr:MAG: biotin synthase BioB [Gammaproteobacteria bacterium]UTW44013.1 biotin synthase BioB [bacterium SCSIO 12844]